MDEIIINLDGIIDQYGWMTSNIKWRLQDAKDKNVRCLINSMGGDVAQAVAISHLFEQHGNVTAELIGFTASAATFVGFGAKTIEAHEDGLWFMHKCSTTLNIYDDLNADGIQKVIDDLNKLKKNAEAIDAMIAQKYLNRCKTAKTVKDIVSLMDEERWMPMSEVAELGFVDRIIPGDTVTDSMRQMAFHNCTDLKLPSLPDAKKVETDHPVNDTKSIVKDIISLFGDLFRNKVTTTPSDKKDTINDKNMNKNYQFVNQILKVEGVDDVNGKITLTADQMQAINDALSTNADSIKKANDAAKAANDKFTNAVASLDTISSNVKDAKTLDEKVSAIKAIMDKVPGVQTNVGAQGGAADKFSDCRKDEINSSDY